MKRIIIAGSRNFHDKALVLQALTEVTQGLNPSQIQIVSGGARGADALGEEIAKQFNTNLAIFPAQWNIHGKSAGYLRNELMAENADVLLAFWKDKSKGTNHMINLAVDYGLYTRVYEL